MASLDVRENNFKLESGWDSLAQIQVSESELLSNQIKG
jgi:hypothetical protein